VGTARIVEDSGSSMSGLTGKNIRGNTKASLALAYLPTSNIDFFIENTYYLSDYINNSTQELTQFQAGVFDIGAVYNF
jgi:hypothetical protein